jgi:transcription antitermination factor NusG
MMIADEEMSIFMFVTRTAAREAEPIDDSNLKPSDRVRIVGGIFAGMEGYITRVHGTKRFVVRIEGIAAIATTFIPKEYIQRVTQ